MLLGFAPMLLSPLMCLASCFFSLPLSSSFYLPSSLPPSLPPPSPSVKSRGKHWQCQRFLLLHLLPPPGQSAAWFPLPAQPGPEGHVVGQSGRGRSWGEERGRERGRWRGHPGLHPRWTLVSLLLRPHRPIRGGLAVFQLDTHLSRCSTRFRGNNHLHQLQELS